MFKKYSKTLAMMLGAFMLFAISMKANSATTVGTSADLSYDIELAINQDLETPATSGYSSGRSAGRKVGAAIGRVAFIATLGYEVVSNYFFGDKLTHQRIDDLLPAEDISKFDL